MSWLIIQI